MSQTNRRAALAAKMRGPGGAYQTKIPGGKAAVSGTRTGSGPEHPTEGGSETSGNRAPKKKTRDGEGSENVDIGATVASLVPHKKKQRVEKTGLDPAVVADVALGAEAGGSMPELAASNTEVARTRAEGNAPATAMVSGPGSPMEKTQSAAVAQEASIPRAPALKKVIGHVGKKTFSELAKMAAEIPDDKYLEKMRGSNLRDNLRRRVALWGQEGMTLAGDSEMVDRVEGEMKKMSEEISRKDQDLLLKQYEIDTLQSRMASKFQEAGELREANEKLQEVHSQKAKEVERLQDELDSSNAREHIAGEQLGHALFREKAALGRAETAEAEVVALKRRVAGLEVELDGRQPADVVIEEYKKSEEYEDALLGAAANDLKRCWAIVRDMTKSDPDHSFDAFCDAFEAAPDEPEEETAGKKPEADVDAPADPVTEEAPAGAPGPGDQNQEDRTQEQF